MPNPDARQRRDKLDVERDIIVNLSSPALIDVDESTSGRSKIRGCAHGRGAAIMHARSRARGHNVT